MLLQENLSDHIIKSIYAITPNELESQSLTRIKVDNQESAKSAIDILCKKGIQVVVITLRSLGVSDKYIDFLATLTYESFTQKANCKRVK